MVRLAVVQRDMGNTPETPGACNGPGRFCVLGLLRVAEFAIHRVPAMRLAALPAVAADDAPFGTRAAERGPMNHAALRARS
jgi:hypothetical protein